MIDKENLGATFTGQVYDIRTKKDGGGRISIDFGSDGLEAVQFIQMIASKKGGNFEIAVVFAPGHDLMPGPPHDFND
jgi:hypothetical protein